MASRKRKPASKKSKQRARPYPLPAAKKSKQSKQRPRPCPLPAAKQSKQSKQRARPCPLPAAKQSKQRARACTLVQTLRQHASEAMSALGKGHTERVYHRAMITSLNRKLIPHRSEVVTPIYYMDEVVGFGRCDIVIGNLAVEFKANKRRPSKASPQLCKYLESLSTSSRAQYKGVVVNFNQNTGAVEVHQQGVIAGKRRG